LVDFFGQIESKGLDVMEEKQIKWNIYPVTTIQYQVLEEIGHRISATIYFVMCLLYKDVAIKALNLEKYKDDLVSL